MEIKTGGGAWAGLVVAHIARSGGLPRSEVVAQWGADLWSATREAWQSTMRGNVGAQGKRWSAKWARNLDDHLNACGCPLGRSVAALNANWWASRGGRSGRPIVGQPPKREMGSHKAPMWAANVGRVWTPIIGRRWATTGRPRTVEVDAQKMGAHGKGDDGQKWSIFGFNLF